MKKLVFLFVSMLFVNSIIGQNLLSNDDLNKAKTYTSMTEALAEDQLKVYKLTLTSVEGLDLSDLAKFKNLQTLFFFKICYYHK